MATSADMSGERETLTIAGRGKNGAVTTEVRIKVLKKLETDLPYDPAIPPLSIHPNDSSSFYSDTRSFMFIVLYL